MAPKDVMELLSDISYTMFNKNFFGIYHGSISARIDQDNFVINTADAIFDKMKERYYCILNTHKRDYRWNIASIEAHVHSTIYTNIHEAKYIAFGMPVYITAYTAQHDKIEFKDYFAKTKFGTLPIYDPGDFSTWYDRNGLEITKHLKKSPSNVMIIKNFGVYLYDRDLNELIKKMAILENSCKLLSLENSFEK